MNCFVKVQKTPIYKNMKYRSDNLRIIYLLSRFEFYNMDFKIDRVYSRYKYQ